MCRYTTLWDQSINQSKHISIAPYVASESEAHNGSVLKATIENKTISVTTHFKKLRTGNNVFIVSVIIKSNCRILQFWMAHS